MSSHLSQLSPAKSQVAGEMLSVLIAAALLTLPVAWTLLALYKRRVLQSMASHSTGWPTTTRADRRAAAITPLTIDSSDVSEAPSSTQRPETDGTLAVTLSQPWRAAALYSIAGIAAASVMTLAQLIQDHTELLPGRLLLLTLVAMWPVVLTILLVAAATRRARVIAVLAYIAGVAAIGAAELAVSPAFSWGQLVMLLVLVNFFPTLLVVIAINRRVRAVGPLVLVFLILVFTGPVLVTGVMQRRNALLRGVAGVGFDLGLGATGVIVSIVLISLVAFALPAWLILAGVGRAYERRRISDQSITVDALWLVVCIVSAVGLSSDDPRWMLIAPLAFGVYKLVAWLGFAVIGPDPDAPQRSGTPPRRLALLRVFALGSRSERLFDAVTVHWRHVGSVELIAGPDLATTTIEPHELLDFVRGRLARRFITDPAALQQRMHELDLQPDHDWRYRVNDFFCTDDSWRAVLARIVAECDAVLMDLRGFDAQRAGCAWEIKELLQTVALGRIVLLVDSTTDEQFLRRAIEEGWTALRADSPNVGMASPVLRLFRVRSLGGATVRALLGELSTATRRVPASGIGLGAGAQA